LLKTVKAILNICLARKIVIILIICGMLITSTAATGQTFAITKEQPDIGTDDGITIEGGAEGEEATDQDDNKTTAIVDPQGRFCKLGTGGTTGKDCIPCDPRELVGCEDTRPGGLLDAPDIATSESGKNKGKSQFITPEIAEMLQSTNNPDDRAKIIFGTLEEQISSGDTEEFTKALDTLCVMASLEGSSKVDCSQPVACGPGCAAIIGLAVSVLWDTIKSDPSIGKPISQTVDDWLKWCMQPENWVACHSPS
jgi:hypothetical protein